VRGKKSRNGNKCQNLFAHSNKFNFAYHFVNTMLCKWQHFTAISICRKLLTVNDIVEDTVILKVSHLKYLIYPTAETFHLLMRSKAKKLTQLCNE
jgi:hypothetical protein